jgi:hypothetical protein
MKNTKCNTVNVNNTSSWTDENEYHFGTYAFDKKAYDNMVRAVRETEAHVDLADSKVDWHLASTCLCALKGYSAFFNQVENTTKQGGLETAQEFGYSYFRMNFAVENTTVFFIEIFRQEYLLNNKDFDMSFSNWIDNQINDDGDFVYFAHTKNPIVVRSMANGMSAELKAKADANGGFVKLTDIVKDMEVA